MTDQIELIKTLAIIMVFMAIITVPSQFNIVQTLKKHGHRSTIFAFMLSDIKKYKKLIDQESNNSSKKIMKISYYGVIIPAIIGILCFITIILIITL